MQPEWLAISLTLGIQIQMFSMVSSGDKVWETQRHFLPLNNPDQLGLKEVSHLITARWRWSWRLFHPHCYSVCWLFYCYPVWTGPLTRGSYKLNEISIIQTLCEHTISLVFYPASSGTAICSLLILKTDLVARCSASTYLWKDMFLPYFPPAHEIKKCYNSPLCCEAVDCPSLEVL